MGNSGTFEYSVYPRLANTYSFFCLSDKLTVSEKGEYIANSVGEVDVYVNYYIAENTPAMKTFKVNIIEEIESFDFSILNENGTEARYYLQELIYKLEIPNISNVSEEDVVVSDNFKVESIEIKDNSIDIIGAFEEAGEQLVKIDIASNGDIVSKEKEYAVYEISDIEIVAKWSAYKQQPYSDGKYHIKLVETPDYPSYLRFSLTINNTNISEQFKVYDITSEKIETQESFYPTSTGEFQFQFEFLGVVVGEIIVVVE